MVRHPIRAARSATAARAITMPTNPDAMAIPIAWACRAGVTSVVAITITRCVREHPAPIARHAIATVAALGATAVRHWATDRHAPWRTSPEVRERSRDRIASPATPSAYPSSVAPGVSATTAETPNSAAARPTTDCAQYREDTVSALMINSGTSSRAARRPSIFGFVKYATPRMSAIDTEIGRVTN